MLTSASWLVPRTSGGSPPVRDVQPVAHRSALTARSPVASPHAPSRRAPKLSAGPRRTPSDWRCTNGTGMRPHAVTARPPHQGQPIRLGRRDGLHELDRKSTRLNSSHVKISYAVFCLKKKNKEKPKYLKLKARNTELIPDVI